MDKRKVSKSSFLTTVGMVSVAFAFASIALLGPQIQLASGQYFQPPPVVVPEIKQLPGFINPLINPTDFTRVAPTLQNPIITEITSQSVAIPALDGIASERTFPGAENLKGPSDFILVQPEEGAVLQRESPYLVALNNGTILASVRRPSSMGMISTPIGRVAFTANSDAFISFSDGALRVRNVDGVSRNIRVNVLTGPLAGKIYSVKPGFELVVSDHKLGREDLRPGDGILRRQSQIFGGGFAGACQYQVQSALSRSAVVTHLAANQSDAKSRRVLADMSRMAAVLNQVQGASGYSSK